MATLKKSRARTPLAHGRPILTATAEGITITLLGDSMFMLHLTHNEYETLYQFVERYKTTSTVD